MAGKRQKIRTMVLVLGDQLNRDSTVFDDFDANVDLVWMAEVAAESEKVWSHKARITVFLSGMRHFCESLRQDGISVDYRTLDDSGNSGSFSSELKAAIAKHQPERIVCVEPGEWSVASELTAAAKQAKASIEFLEDRHFCASRSDFAAHARGRKQLRLEFFYRELRKRFDVLMDNGKPIGGKWNYDSDNRKAFGKKGPEAIPEPIRFAPDKITRDVMKLIEKRFASHPGRLDQFDWPVTRSDALLALEDFVRHRLPEFGNYQDAMWTDQPYLYHSRLSVALNLKLLDPREVVAAAEAAYVTGAAPLNAVEGFIRQILGWREYVRGIYWHYMPEYLERNTLEANLPLPDFYWTGETKMNCLKQAVKQTLDYGYAHHIQRLMVTGLFSLLYGVDPQEIHRWYLAVYVDAVEWVELPNTLGMSQFADGSVMASKPYAATGKYIQRMSNYCQECEFDPAKTEGEKACPISVFYWDFLMRHRTTLASNHRMSLQLKNIDRKSAKEQASIRALAQDLRREITLGRI